jgi:hypothetical protein
MGYEEQRPVIDLNRLRDDLAKARERVRDLEQLVDLAERLYSNAGQTPSNTRTSQDSPEVPEGKPATSTLTAPVGGPFAGLGAREAAVQLLKTSGRAWKVDAATREMLSLGWQTDSPAPATVVRSAMMRDRRVKRVAPGQFRYDEANDSTADASEQPSGHPGEGANGQFVRASDGRFSARPRPLVTGQAFIPTEAV